MLSNNFKRIGFKLTAIMLCVILIGVAATVSVAVAISSNIITRESLAKIERDTKGEAYNMNSWLSVQKANIKTLANVLSRMDDLSEDSLPPVFKAVMDDNKAYFEVYMGFPDGLAHTGSGYVFDYSWWHAYERGWYKLALTDTSLAHVTSPYIDAQTGELCITALHAVMRDGELLGVVAADIFVTDLQNMTLAATLDSEGYAMLLDSNGDILVHPDENYAPGKDGEYRNLGTVMNGAYAQLWSQLSAASGAIKYKDAEGLVKYYTSHTLSSTGWHLATVLPAKTVTQSITSVIMIVIPLTLVILALAALLIFLTVRNIIGKPIAALSEASAKLAKGDTEIRLTSHSDDEIGAFTEAFLDMADSTKRQIAVLERLAAGDLTAEILPRSDRDAMNLAIINTLDSLNAMFEEIDSAAAQVKIGSNQIADGSQILAQGSTEQAGAVEQLSASITQITQQTDESALLANRAAGLSETIRQNAEKGSRQMEQMTAAVREINDAGHNINKIIKVIDDIAFQTNILALNAAVEAARAGQHGKGFAVVAEEVRSLAAKSAEAAKDTGKLIANSVEKAELGTRIAGETAASLLEIVTGINESDRLIGDIAKSSAEQSQAIAQINVSLDQVSQVVQQNSAAAEESASASQEMSGQAVALEELVARFKLNSGDRLPDGASARRGLPGR